MLWVHKSALINDHGNLGQVKPIDISHKYTMHYQDQVLWIPIDK